MYLKSSGQRYLETAEGIDVWEQALKQDAHQELVLVGQPARLQGFLSRIYAAGRNEMQALDQVSLATRVTKDLKERMAEVLKIKKEQLDEKANFADFGFDSIGLAELGRVLTEYFRFEVAPSIFFSYSTIEKLNEYLIEKHRQALEAFYQPEHSEESTEKLLTRRPREASREGIQKSASRRFLSLSEPALEEPIAIIGMSGRFPGADNVEELWDLLSSGKKAIEEIPRERWDWKEYFHSPGAGENRIATNRGGFIKGLEEFDPLFFEISPMEAQAMDPRQRLILQEAWRAFEDAGCAGERVRGSACGVFIGVEEGGSGRLAESQSLVTSSHNAILAARISYFLDLQGPNLAINTACSSGLVAVHYACQSLQRGDCEMALAGGINVLTSPLTYVVLSQSGMLSADGECYAFDNRANGLAPGEAVAVVVLKTLSKAVADGDPIYAVIKGSGVNYDGRTNGITAPSALSQAKLIESVLKRDNANPENIQYVLAHSVGSPLGDPIEAQALSDAFRKYTDKKQFCAIGSVKPLIGHTFAASGVASLIGMCLAIKHGRIPASFNYRQANEYIDFSSSPFYVNLENRSWPLDRDRRPRCGIVGATGMSGTNALALIEEYIPEDTPQGKAGEEPVLIVLSAKIESSLKEYANNLRRRLSVRNDLNLSDVAYTLQIGREPMDCRLAIVASSKDSLIDKLDVYLNLSLNTEATEELIYVGNAGGRQDPTRSGLAPAQGIAGNVAPDQLSALARQWAAGAAFDWASMYKNRAPRRLNGLPTYPFARRSLSTDGYAPATIRETRGEVVATAGSDTAGGGAKAAEYYAFDAKFRSEEYQEEYLTFCPFEREMPGFSMTRVLRSPRAFADEYRLILEKQIEMRQVIFSDENLDRVNTVMDIGCGCATDIIEIVKHYPHIKADGFTITGAQAELAAKRIRSVGLSKQARVFHANSAKDAFPGVYDLILGFEVICHIADKNRLFENIRSSLSPSGRILLMDFMANLRGSIIDSNVDIAISTQQEWAELLAENSLVIDDLIDLSPQIANYVIDPNLEENIADFPEAAQRSSRNFANMAVSLRSDWISYCLFKIKKDAVKRSLGDLKEHNLSKMRERTPYSAALMKMQGTNKRLFPLSLARRDSLIRPDGGYPPTDPGPVARNWAETEVTRKQGAGDVNGVALERQVRGIRLRLQEIFQNILQLTSEELEAAGSFKAMGINSLVSVQLLEEINVAFDLREPTSIMFECHDLGSLAEHLVRKIGVARSFDRAQTDGSSADRPIAEVASREGRNKLNEDVAEIAAREGRKRLNEDIAEVAAREGRNRLNEDIAIVGVSCRCAGASNPTEFWDLIVKGRECIDSVGKRHPGWEDFFSEHSADGSMFYSGSMENSDCFDSLFFDISPIEAEQMDCTHRVLLEGIYAALEDAGYDPLALNKKRVGTFIGYMGAGAISESMSHHSMLGSDGAILSSRIAYHLNLVGPAVTVNTACSSSLVAIELACEKLKNSNIEMAVAGGITIYSHPASFVMMRNAGMLSPTGRCYPFDERADGIVVGDGMGIVILMPMSKAIEDGAHIYGIIRGIGANQDGKTSGIMAPSFVSQSNLEREVYRRADIPPQQIQYVETHGTGTKLGDPIEVHALIEAFREHTDQRQFCALSSLKANIGHTTAAAGVLGLIKVLLSIKNRCIPPSINFSQANRHINFDESPFYVNSQPKPWRSPATGSRIAAVSAFGFSGTNAHLVVEEYRPDAEVKREATAGRPEIILISAKTPEQLKERVAQLLAFIKRLLGESTEFRASENEDSSQDITLSDVAYTLQIGREAMEERLATTVTDWESLVERLERYCADPSHNGEWRRGSVKGDKDSTSFFKSDDDAQDLIATWLAKGKYYKLIDLWVKGLAVDWTRLYSANSRLRRISLPTYPFAKERYWMEVGHKAPGIRPTGVSQLHPLLHQNDSNAFESKFGSTFTGEEFFFNDHQINDLKLLPGVGHLEMARAAVARTLDSDSAMALSDVVWLRPMILAEGPHHLQIGVQARGETEADYEIYSAEEDDEELVYSQGHARLIAQVDRTSLDLARLREICTRQPLTNEQLYAAFASRGLKYGSGHRGITDLFVGLDADQRPQALATLRLPQSVANTADEFVLHPSMMDCALQASVGLGLAHSVTGPQIGKPMAPFALEALSIYAQTPARAYAWARFSKGSNPGDAVQKLDVSLCDEQGAVCVEFSGFSLRALSGELTEHSSKTVLLQPRWEDLAISAGASAMIPDAHRELFVLGSFSVAQQEAIERRLSGRRTHLMAATDKSLVVNYESMARRLFESAQQRLQQKLAQPYLLQVVIAVDDSALAACYSGISGLLKTASHENPNLITQCIQVPASINGPALIDMIDAEARDLSAQEIRYHYNRREVKRLTELVSLDHDADPEHSWRDDGVYLITGGAGGLGLILAEAIAGAARNSTLILTGRSEPTADKQARMARLMALGSQVEYQRVDVADYGAVVKLIERIMSRRGKLTGVIHSAGLIRDNFIIKKTAEELHQVFAPKVAGLVNLDEATSTLSLDHFICFSSVAGLVGNPGQADYAAANAFMDAYASHRSVLVATGKRHGRTLSINWPLWAEGGMQADDAVKAQLKRDGLIPLSAPAGLAALDECLRNPAAHSQVAALAGDAEKIRSAYIERARRQLPSAGAVAIAKTESSGDSASHDKAHQYFKQQLAKIIKLPADRIDVDAVLEQYGIDSVMVIELTNHLEKTFGPLPKTLFFEYQTIRALTDYFVQSHAAELAPWLGSSSANIAHPVSEVGERTSLARRRPQRRGAQLSGQAIQDAAIAIIGLSGRYPQANDLDEYWENLRTGRDCITEIPPDRWDHSLYFDPQKGQPGKSYSKWGGFIGGVDLFDPLFFNISPREAQVMDPQERLFLQCVYHTLEDAGYTRESLKTSHRPGQAGRAEGNVGVFVGVMYEEYQLYGAQAQALGQPYALGGNPSSIANRVSYFCNFHGPSLAVDTMCSSSLTAIHLACQSLMHGECEAAIAGGVNVSVHPNKYLALSQWQFASSSGRCESFGEGGDGYVPGEGVGAALLKPLSKAIADGDHIYGVIRGSSVNHGGKTNGYTVPNPNAQCELIMAALEKAKVAPRTVSYIEAHGTGTLLGDPIEIAGLTKAFNQLSGEKLIQTCAIGSVKSNIGHCESAAGIAGVTKVLLQMKHGELAPSLHSQSLNPNIDFGQTPFKVQQKVEAWNRPKVRIDGIEREYPRIAGISSFGAGGANAHIIIEEYVSDENQQRAALDQSQTLPVVVPISARSEERLQAYVEKWLNFLSRMISESGSTDSAISATESGHERIAFNLMDVAYTLQTGREPLECRVAFLAKDLTDLTEKMKRFVSNRNDLEGAYYGRATDDSQKFLSDEDVKKSVITKWVLNRRLEKLAEFWVKGLEIDWRLLVDEESPTTRRPRRISLPTYPFDQRRCWAPLPKPSAAMANGAIANNGAIGGMIKRIVPAASLGGKSVVVFEAQLSPHDRVLDHHRVEAQRILPGVAYLEMVIEAAKYTYPDQALVLKDVVWMQPLLAQEAAQAVITKFEPHDHEIQYEISSIRDGKKQTHARGLLSDAIRQSHQRSADLAEIKRSLTLRWEGEADKKIFYREYQKNGIEYGPYFQGVQALWGSENESLGLIELPKEYQEDLSRYHLPVGLVDSALQCIGGIWPADDRPNGNGEIHLPYSIGRFEVYRPLESQLFAHIKRLENCRYDITLLDGDGEPILAAQDFVMRPVNSSSHHHNYVNRWYPRSIAAGSDRGDRVSGGCCLIIHRENSFRLEKRIGEIEEGSVSVLLGDRTERRGEREWAVDVDNPADIAGVIRGLAGVNRVYFLAALVGEQQYSLEPSLIEKEQKYTVLSWFRCLKALIDHGYDQEAMDVVVVTQDSQALPWQQEVNVGGGGLSGLTQSLAKEYPHWKVRCIDLSRSDLEGSRDPQWIVDYLCREPASITGFPIAYRDGVRYENQIRPLFPPKAGPGMFKNGGVYIIIGGAGGLGRVTTEYLVDRYQAHVVWTGRRKIDEEISQCLGSFAGKPGTVEYIQADLTNEAELKKARDVVKGKYRRINGVIHSALVLRDQSLRGIDEDRFKEVLDPKVNGSVVLGAVFRDEELDWLCFYSSIQSFYGAAGQSNYAAGCSFKDTYAEALRRACPFPVFVINWGYWGSVGVVASEGYRSKMEALGIGSLEPRDGMNILESVGANQIPQLLAIKLSPTARARWGIDQHGEELYATTQGAYFERIVDTLKSDSAREKIDSSRFEHSDAADTSLNKYVVSRLLSVLNAMGLENILTEPKDTSVIKEELEISGKHDLLFDEVLRILRQEGVIAIEKGVVRFAAPRGNQIDAHDADRRKDDILSRYPDLIAHLALADACLQSLQQVLRGRVLATDVLFPNSSTALVEGIYKKNAYADYFNDQMADAVETFIQSKMRDFPDSVKVRILEVGAGTGGTSESLFKRLNKYESCVEYVYTDISKRFLIHAQEQYSPTTPYLSLQLFDVERPLSEQAMRRGYFDIVIAANVLHATKNIGNTLRNVKACLKRNGLLILNEIGNKRPFTTLTFGLLDGWWRAEDKEVRIEGSPALSPTRWERRLIEEGFEKVFVAPAVSDLAQQYVIVAESNGQAQQEKAAREIGVKGRESRGPNSALNSGGAHGATSSLRGARPVASPVRPAEKIEVSEEQLKLYLEESLSNAVAGVLKLSDGEINPSAVLSDLGVDSIIAVELVRMINASLGLALKTTVIFDYPSISRLAEHLHLEYKNELMPHWSRRNPDVRAADSSTEPFILQERRDRRAVDPISGSGENSEESVKSYIEEALLTNVAEVLNLSAGDIDSDKALSDVGVDSIVAVDLVRRINAALGLSLKTTVIFDYFSIRLLTEHIYRDHRADLDHGLENGMALRSRVATSDDADHRPDANRHGQESDLEFNDDHLNTIADELMQGRMSLEETLERLRN